MHVLLGDDLRRGSAPRFDSETCPNAQASQTRYTFRSPAGSHAREPIFSSRDQCILREAHKPTLVVVENAGPEITLWTNPHRKRLHRLRLLPG